MKWLTNIDDHRKPNAKHLFSYSSQACTNPQLREIEWQEHLNWVNKHIIGLPQASEKYNQQQLVDMGMIGIYEQE